jgi:hypothetical protein
MAKTTQYNIQLKEEVSASLRNIEGKLATTNAKMGEMQKAGEKAFDAVKVTAYGAAAVAALGQIVDFTGQAVKAYGDFQEKQLRLEAQLKVTGNQLGRTAGQVLDLASALEDATGIDDGDILDAIATIQTFQNVTGKTFDEAVKQAANLSVVFGDVDTAAKQLGAALENPAENLDKLKKASVYFTDAEKEQIKAMQEVGDLAGAQAVVLDKVKEKYDGLAESINVGVNGAIKSLNNSWDDFMKFFGEGAANVLAPQIKGLAALIKTLTPPVGGSGKTALPSGTRDSFRSAASGEADAIKGAEEFFAQQREAAEAERKRLAEVAAMWASAKKGPGLLAPPINPNAGQLVTSGYVAPDSPYVDSWSTAMTGDGGAAAQAVKVVTDFKAAALLGPGAKEKTWAEQFREDLDAMLPSIDLIGQAWGQVSTVFQNYSKLQEEATQANLDRMSRELDVYTAAQDLKIEIAKRNGEDTGQLEVDKANEVYTRKKALADAEREAKKKAWAAQRDASVTEAVMAGAVAGLDALKLLPNVPLALAMGAVAVATTAANVSMIAGQKMPAFAGGGIVPGSFYDGDRVMSRLNSREMVLNMGQQSRLFAIANGAGGASAQRVVNIERVYGTVDAEFLDGLDRSQDLRSYRGVS